MPTQEHAPLGKPYIFGYEQNDPSFPIIAINKDPRDLPIPTFGGVIPDPEWVVAFPNNKFYEVKPTDTDQRVLWVYMITPGPAIDTSRFDEDGATVAVTRTRKLSPAITPGETLVSTTWTRITKQNSDSSSLAADEVVEVRTVPGNVLNADFYDPQTDTVVNETRQLVSAASSIPSITSLFVDYKRVPNSNSSLTAWDVKRTYPAGVTSKTIVEFEPDLYTYPALMSGVSVAVATKTNGDVISKVNPIIEAERPLYVSKRITRTFTTTQPTNADQLSGLYPIKPYRHRYDGVFFSLFTGPVLNDSGSLTYTTGSGNPTWGAGVVETYSYSATVPTYTQYTTSRASGDWKQVAPSNAKKLASGLWMVTTVLIPIL